MFKDYTPGELCSHVCILEHIGMQITITESQNVRGWKGPP